MGCNIKVQKITRPKCTRSTANFLTAVVETKQIEKGEQMECNLEDRDTLILRRKIGSSTFSVVHCGGDVEFTDGEVEHGD